MCVCVCSCNGVDLIERIFSTRTRKFEEIGGVARVKMKKWRFRRNRMGDELCDFFKKRRKAHSLKRVRDEIRSSRDVGAPDPPATHPISMDLSGGK